MSYRTRRPPTDQKVAEHERMQMYRRVFGTPEGQLVLDDIVQKLCGVDAYWQVGTAEEAFKLIARRNVGLAIAGLALGSPDDQKPVEVKQ